MKTFISFIKYYNSFIFSFLSYYTRAFGCTLAPSNCPHIRNNSQFNYDNVSGVSKISRNKYKLKPEIYTESFHQIFYRRTIK